jgi:uncharacterized protein
MVIKLSHYEDGVHHLDFKKSVNELGLNEPFIGNVEVSCKMDKSHNQIYLSCDVTSTAVLICDRCATDLEATLSKHFESVYLFKSSEEKKEDEDGMYYISHETQKIDITADVLEFCGLSMPLKILCDDDCKGLCTSCGADLNESNCDCSDDQTIDVWEPLKKLKDKLN